MDFLVFSKNEEDQIKNEGARVVTTLFINLSDAQGQLTPKSVVESCLNSNISKLIWLVLLPIIMMKIHFEIKSGHNISPITSLWRFFQMLKCS